MRDQLYQQDYQIQFLKEKVAKLDVQSANEIKALTRRNEHLTQNLQQRDHHVEALELQLTELREQVNMVQNHYHSMQECMRRDQADKQRL